jgi:oligoendopeptidase F
MSVETLIHEAGHAFHNYFSAGNVPLYSARHSGSEFAEVASMSMELLTRPYLDQFYSQESLPGILRDQLIRAIDLFPLIAKIDAFQHWVYTAGENGGTIDDPIAWRQKWMELEKRFNPDLKWQGHERYQETGWQYLHVFCVPFYFVDYGIAQVGALTVWANSLKDYDHSIALYKKALKLGGTKPLPELFETIGAKFGLDEKTLRPVLEAVREHIN